MIGTIQEGAGSYNLFCLVGGTNMKCTVQVLVLGEGGVWQTDSCGQAQRGAGLELHDQPFAFKLYKSAQTSGK